MRQSSDSNISQSERAGAIQPSTPSFAETSSARAGAPPSAGLNQYSLIGKSIVIQGEIASSDSLYIYGRVEGSISAPEHRVTIGKEGAVNADIDAREIVILGDVCGKLDSSDRVEIRSGGSLHGDLAAHRISIEDGTFLKAVIDIRRSAEKEEIEAPAESQPAWELREAIPTAETEVDHRTWVGVAVSELG